MMKLAAFVLLVFSSSIALACGSSASRPEADVEQAVREYLRAIDGADAELFCSRIVPDLGYFIDSAECRAASDYHQKGPRIVRFQDEGDLTATTVSDVKFTDTKIDGSDASTFASVAWSGQTASSAVDLGSAQLLVRLRNDGGWRVANFESVAANVQRDPSDVAQAVKALYDAEPFQGRAGMDGFCRAVALRASGYTDFTACTSRGGYQPITRNGDLGDHISRPVLAAIRDIRIVGDHAAVRGQLLTLDNGVLSHPRDSGDLIFAREVGRWGYVTEPAAEALRPMFAVEP